MPKGILDEDIWEKAKDAVDKSKYSEDSYYAIVMTVYKNMGGKLKQESYKERLNNLYNNINKSNIRLKEFYTLEDLKDELKDLPTAWGNCGDNSRYLKSIFNGQTVKVHTRVKDGEQYLNGNHVIYITPDNKYVADVVIQNEPYFYNKVKSCELSHGLFFRDCYFRNMEITSTDTY